MITEIKHAELPAILAPLAGGFYAGLDMQTALHTATELPRAPLHALARLLAQQAVADYLTSEAQQKQQDTAERPNRGIPRAAQTG